MSKFNIPDIEQRILEFWRKEEIFHQTLKKPNPKGEYVFYDGPPFATGLPHYGHIVASLIKDMVPRFWTMQGYLVERRWGWDCHGLPIENIVEQELGLKQKKDILQIGVSEFNQACQSKVLTYRQEWRRIIERLGRWADMENDYKTMDLSYMESVWWVFKELWQRGLIYESYKSMHICPRCETTLSQSEVAEGYRQVNDLSVVVKFPLKNKPDTFFLAWTTTPWTLIANTALAVNPDITYLKAQVGSQVYILAKSLVEQVLAGSKYQPLETMTGRELVGQSYEPLFTYYHKDDLLVNKENGWQVYPADFVTLDEGTGIVHIAPAFGEEDMQLAATYQLPFIQHLNMDGIIKKEAKDFAGRPVKPKHNLYETDEKIIDFLRRQGKVLKTEMHSHTYPHCWRCETPLLNYATTSLYVAVTKIKEDLLKNAEVINWVPAHIKDGRFGRWLEGARDWSISRQRFWAAAIPLWRCQACRQQVIVGSIRELEKLSQQEVTDLHKHIVDQITFPCSNCQGVMKRIPDVFDCWFESGSMPYAQQHYPFENKDKFERNFPANFIGEGVDQTRAWFYYLHVLATALKSQPAFLNVIVNGIVLAEDGKKMSKRLKNYPEPEKIFAKYGADAMRFYLASSSVMKAEDLRFSEKEVAEVVKKVIIILLNVLSFYKLYAPSASSLKPSRQSQHILDQWILARLDETEESVTDGYKNYDLNKATRPLKNFITDLSTWYLRRSRRRFKQGGSEKEQALATLSFCLFELSKIMAPVMPFAAEYIYQELKETIGLSAEKESVHLEDWPQPAPLNKKRQTVLAKMRLTREIVEKALSQRGTAGLPVRQVLSRLTVDLGQRLPAEYLDLIKEEVNVKEVKVLMSRKGKNKVLVKLETILTQELKEEGLKREIIRQVNAQRKRQGLTIKDKVKLGFVTEDKLLKQVLSKYSEEILKETLAVEFIQSASEYRELTIAGQSVKLALVKES